MQITLSQFAEEVFEKAGINDLPGYLTLLIEREAKRLWHIQRCKPKELKEPKPLGRPGLSVEAKRVRELGDTLKGIYLNLKQFYGPEYEDNFGEQERLLEDAIGRNDLGFLNQMLTQQPWIKRRRNVQEDMGTH